jgi:hypothetical protein
MFDRTTTDKYMNPPAIGLSSALMDARARGVLTSPWEFDKLACSVRTCIFPGLRRRSIAATAGERRFPHGEYAVYAALLFWFKYVRDPEIRFSRPEQRNEHQQIHDDSE